MARDISTRTIIDKIDAKLGNVEKEKKFDLSVIAGGIVLLIVGIVIIALAPSSKALIFLGLFLMLIGLSFVYVMTKEYIADCKKAKKMAK